MWIFLFWCERRDLNPYESPHTPLKRARLPIPPLSLTTIVIISDKTAVVNNFLEKKFEFFLARRLCNLHR